MIRQVVSAACPKKKVANRNARSHRRPGRRRQNRQRFILISAVLVVAAMVIWALVGSLAFLAANLRVFGCTPAQAFCIFGALDDPVPNKSPEPLGGWGWPGNVWAEQY